ncbi:MAG: tail fiber domain-containing protein [Bacteroidota bacterium]
MNHTLSRIIVTSLVFIIFLLPGLAQVAINSTGADPDATAMLDITSTEKGVLIPRMTTNQRNGIENPTRGLLVYDTTAKSFWYYHNEWIEIASTDISRHIDYGDILDEVASVDLGNYPIDIKAAGHYLYIIEHNSDKISVYDISDPINPTLASSLSLPSSAKLYSLAIAGDYAYAVSFTETDNLYVIDISDPTNISNTGSYDIGSRCRDIQIQDNMAYVLDQTGDKLRVLDISMPTAPTQIGELAIDAPSALFIEGNYAYIGDGISTNMGLHVVDITTPSVPVLLSYMATSTNEYPTHLIKVGNYLYFGTLDSGGTPVIDLNDPLAPVELSNEIGSNEGLTYDNNTLYVYSSSGGGLLIYNITDGSNPALIAVTGPDNTASDIVTSGDYVYVLDSDYNQLLVFPKLTYYVPAVADGTATFLELYDDLGDHTASENIQLNNRFLSNDGDNEGINITDNGDVTFSGKITTGGNINLNNQFISNDGDNEGISIDNNGDINLSGKLMTGGNIALNNQYISNDGDDEGLSIDNDGITYFAGANTGNNNFIMVIENTADDDTERNDGIEIIAGHTTYNPDRAFNRFIQFSTPGGENLGQIRQDAANSVVYTTTSDIRLKENIRPTAYSLEDILDIRVSDYNYKTDKDQHVQTGFLAQQLHKIYPVAVTEGGENEKTDPWTVDYSKLTPLLVKGIQEQQALINAQQQEIDILKEQVAELRQLRALLQLQQEAQANNTKQ